MKKRLLIVDRDSIFSKGLKYSLEQLNYEVDRLFHGTAMLQVLENRERDYDMFIVDIDIRDMDGLRLIKDVRNLTHVPLIATGQAEQDIIRIMALENGADDFLDKPYSKDELKARIRAIFRRIEYEESKAEINHIIQVKDFTVDTLKRKVLAAGKQLYLTATEFQIFLVLISNPGITLTREEILENIWGADFFCDIRSIDVHITKIREKLDDTIGKPEYIGTKWGEGYFFNNL